MNELLQSVTTQETDLFFTLVGFFLCFICSLVLRYTYENMSSSLSGKFHIANILPLLAVTTFLVILIVKSSLALSLGLVGALSIVRFRTPIKEPEELVYLFLSITLGLGFGSGQIIIPLTIFIFIILIIWFLLSRTKYSKNSDYNLIIEFSENQEKLDSNILIVSLKKLINNFDLIKYEHTTEVTTIILRINLVNVSEIEEIVNLIRGKYTNASVSFYESKQLY